MSIKLILIYLRLNSYRLYIFEINILCFVYPTLFILLPQDVRTHWIVISQTEQRLSKKIVTFGVELGNLFYLESFDRILIAVLSIS